MRKTLVSLILAVMLGSLLTTTPAGASVPDKPYTETLCEDYSDSVARLYTAGLGRDPEQGGFDFWITEYTLGNWTFPRMAQFFVESPEFQESYGTLTQDEFIRQLYRNVLGREGEAGGIAFWNGEMTAGMTRATVLMRFAESPENIENSGTVAPALGPFNEGREPGFWRCGPSLAEAMFTIDDFSAGWEALPFSTSSTPRDETDCTTALYVPQGTETVGFGGPSSSDPTVAQGIYLAPTVHGADRYMEQMRQALVNCGTYLDGATTIEMNKLEFPAYLDDSIAIHITFTTRADGQYLELHGVVMQIDAVIGVVQYSSETSVDPSVVEAWATLAAERIAGLRLS